MSRIQLIIGSITFVVTSILVTSAAHAVQRTHVSAAFGSDANTATNCTAVAPCRFFQAAMSVTDNNGEVIVLDSGGYGAVTIAKSLALIAPTGVYAGISVFPGANGVTIATPGINVVLRGLAINGQGGNNGINMTAGNRLTVENCVISNLTQNGINVNAAATVRVTDSIVRDNGFHGICFQNGAKATITRAVLSGHDNNSGGIGVEGNAASTTTIIDVADSTLDGNSYGIFTSSNIATATIKISVRDSRIVRNADSGLVTLSNQGAAVSLSASNNMLANNGQGIIIFSPGTKAWVSGNTVSDNTRTGLFNNGGVFTSAGNNAVYGNGTNTNAVITTVAAQ